MADWPHAPVHRLDERGAYMVTAGTYRKHHLFAGPHKLGLLRDRLLEHASEQGRRLQAWAVFSNHYHFIAVSPPDPASLRALLQRLHSGTARELNNLDGTEGRTVWFTYWDTYLSYERSYFARLHYVHDNPVHHGLTTVATNYEWCSASWFKGSAGTAFFKTVSSFKTDRLAVRDDFDVEA